jgi:hypothetical protein
MPAFTTEPADCKSSAVYTCEYKSGPYTGSHNLCDLPLTSVGGANSLVNFDTANGMYSFTSNDMVTFPPGAYNFEITVTIGSSSEVVSFQMMLSDPCPAATLTIVNNPFAQMSYTLRDQAAMRPFDRTLVGTSSTTVNCGIPTVKLVDGVTGQPLGSPFDINYQV